MLAAMRKPTFVRWTLVAFGAFIAAYAALKIVTGQPFYANWWGGMVFAPVTFLVGLALAVLAPRLATRHRAQRRRRTVS